MRPSPSVRRGYTPDRDGFTLFVESAGTALLQAAQHVVDPQTARDAVQDALLTTWKRWEKVCEMDNPFGWARKVTVNAAIDLLNSSNRQPLPVADETLAGAHQPNMTAGVDTTADPVISTATNNEWLSALPEMQRACATMHYLWDLPVAEIAEALDCAEGTVKVHLHRARLALAAAAPPTYEPSPAPAAAGERR